MKYGSLCDTRVQSSVHAIIASHGKLLRERVPLFKQILGDMPDGTDKWTLSNPVINILTARTYIRLRIWTRTHLLPLAIHKITRLQSVPNCPVINEITFNVSAATTLTPHLFAIAKNDRNYKTSKRIIRQSVATKHFMKIHEAAKKIKTILNFKQKSVDSAYIY